MDDFEKLNLSPDSDTFPKLFLRQRAIFGDNKPAMYKKDLGIWNAYTWGDCYENIKYISLGLVNMGLKRGDKVCIIGDNDPQWFWAEIAVQSAGGVVVGIFMDANITEVTYIAQHSDSVFAFAKDQEQVDKFLKIKNELPAIRKIIYWEPEGMWSYRNDPYIINLEQVIASGKTYENEHPRIFEHNVEQGKGNDTSVILYTSGTTGLPKGAMLSHSALIKGVLRASLINPVLSDDIYVSIMPPAWTAEQLTGIGGWVSTGCRIYFPEKPDTVMANIREAGPQTLFFGPRQWDGFLSMVQARMVDASIISRLIYRLFLPVGYKVAEFRLSGEPADYFWSTLYKVANWFLFRPIRDRLGLSKIRNAFTGGSALGPDVYKWYHAIGCNLKDSYGLTECNPGTVQQGGIKIGSAGKPYAFVEVRISDEGEVLLHSSSKFSGYYKNEDATDKLFEGKFIKTGDAGFFDDDGNLIILDRLNDLLTLNDGTKYSASYIENRMKFSPYVKDLMVVGSDFLVAIIIIDFDNVGKWAEKRRIAYTTFADLSQKQEIYNLIEKDIARVNRLLPPNASLKRFALLPKEFDSDEGDLTRSKKLKRAAVSQRYQSLLDCLYSQRSSLDLETEVKYRDGRVGKIVTLINIKDIDGNV